MESWILDFSAFDYITGNPSLISNSSPSRAPQYVMIANGSKVQATDIGQASPLPSLSPNCLTCNWLPL